MNKPKTKLTLKTCYGKVKIVVDKDDMNISDIYELSIKPMLLAAGYSASVIEEYFGE